MATQLPPRPQPGAAPKAAATAIAVVIPSLGSGSLDACVDAVHSLEPAPARVIVVLSGGAELASRAGVEVTRSARALGFAAATNLGIAQASRGADRIALLNDDALPPPRWLEALGEALDRDPRLAAVQGTLADAGGGIVDGRGITLDRWALPVQIDRGLPVAGEDHALCPVLAVSGTAGLWRTEALAEVSTGAIAPFDPAFGSYHEDLDLGLRLWRLGWRSAWVGGVPARHLGSASGAAMRWRHPWWILANRWRALAGNLAASALLGTLPRLLRGELRALRTLSRSNPRAPAVAAAVAAAWPWLIAAGWRRSTPGQRLAALPEPP
jgi:GT2 family glycosyltransferase